MKYIFETVATMKEYNNKKWWIDPDIVTRKIIKADTIDTALERFQALVEEEHYVSISNNAIKNKNPMYLDTENGEKQIGFVITGKSNFQTDDGRWVSNYIDLWVDILTVIDTKF